MRTVSMFLALMALGVPALSNAASGVSEVRALFWRFDTLDHAVTPYLLDSDHSDRVFSNLVEYEAGIAEELSELGFDAPSSRDEVYATAEKSSIVILADRHNETRLQRAAEDMLTHLMAANDRQKVFIFELIDVEYQADVEAYFEGRITAEALRAKVKWDDNIGYAWDSYKTLLDFLGKHRDKIKTWVTLRADKSLSIYDMYARDSYVFRMIQNELEQDPSVQTVILHGKDHLLGKAGLAGRFYRAYPNQTMLVQTVLPSIHLELVERGIEVTDSTYVRLTGDGNANVFYRHSADPMKNTSTLGWLSGSIIDENAPNKDALKAKFAELQKAVADSYDQAVARMMAGDEAGARASIAEVKRGTAAWVEAFYGVSGADLDKKYERVREPARQYLDAIIGR